MMPSPRDDPQSSGDSAAAEFALVDAILELARHWKLLAGGTLVIAIVSATVALQMPATYTGRTSILPPQPPQSLANMALGQLGALGSLAGTAAGLRGPADQYLGLLKTETVADRIIDQLGLMQVYGAKLREDARLGLSMRTRISADRRDGLITIEVEDRDPSRAAAIANRYVTELSRLTQELALTEAQQRRRFFERQLEQIRRRLSDSQTELQAAGFNQAALRTEPRTTAENYARLRAEAEAAEVKLRALRANLTDNAPEVQAQLGIVAALRSRLATTEKSVEGLVESRYVNAFREFKYQETLFELVSKQFELARVDESREGLLIQVVDAARAPERRSRPKRAEIVTVSTAAASILLALFVLIRRAWRRAIAQRQMAASSI